MPKRLNAAAFLHCRGRHVDNPLDMGRRSPQEGKTWVMYNVYLAFQAGLPRKPLQKKALSSCDSAFFLPYQYLSEVDDGT